MDDLTRTLTSYYDEVPYESHPFPQTAVEHLEAVASLFGLRTPPPPQARVLEIGCAAGGNLLPFAARFPQADCVGIDLSQVQIRQGAAAIGQAGLDNVRLRALDVTQVDASLGRFDYIICHGVYSWVPPPVQDAILRVCGENLSPDGVAYVSYNTYPGWKSREIVRDAMMLRGGPRSSAADKLAYARGMLDFLDQSATPQSVLKQTLNEMMPLIRGGSESYLLHEFLEPCNTPCYLRDFVDRAAARGLAYLADAEPASMFVQNYAEAVREPLLRECGNSQVMMEQYLDFLVNRPFRQSLLVPRERAQDIRYRLDLERLHGFEFAGTFAPLDGQPLAVQGDERPCTAWRGVQVVLKLPVHRAVAMALDACYPATLSVPALLADVAARTGESRDAVEPVVMAMLEQLVILGAARMRRTPSQAATEVGDLPMAQRAVRQSPGLGAGATAVVCNLWHERVEVSLLEQLLLRQLDGKTSVQALTERLVAEAGAGRVRLIKGGEPITDVERLRDFARAQVEVGLAELRRKGLLVAGPR